MPATSRAPTDRAAAVKRARLILRRYQPSNADAAEPMVDKFEGRLDELFRQLQKKFKYDHEPTEADVERFEAEKKNAEAARVVTPPSSTTAATDAPATAEAAPRSPRATSPHRRAAVAAATDGTNPRSPPRRRDSAPGAQVSVAAAIDASPIVHAILRELSSSPATTANEVASQMIPPALRQVMEEDTAHASAFEFVRRALATMVLLVKERTAQEKRIADLRHALAKAGGDTPTTAPAPSLAAAPVAPETIPSGSAPSAAAAVTARLFALPCGSCVRARAAKHRELEQRRFCGVGGRAAEAPTPADSLAELFQTRCAEHSCVAAAGTAGGVGTPSPSALGEQTPGCGEGRRAQPSGASPPPFATPSASAHRLQELARPQRLRDDSASIGAPVGGFATPPPVQWAAGHHHHQQQQQQQHPVHFPPEDSLLAEAMRLRAENDALEASLSQSRV